DFNDDPSCITVSSTLTPSEFTRCQAAYGSTGFATAGAVGSMSISNGNPYFLVATKQLGLYFQGRLEGQQALDAQPRSPLGQGFQHDRRVGHQEQPYLFGTGGVQQPNLESLRQQDCARRQQGLQPTRR